MSKSEQSAYLEALQQAIEGFCQTQHGYQFNPDDPLIAPYTRPYGSEEILAATQCLLKGDVKMGARTKAFEHAFSHARNSRFGVMSNSGSSAKLLAISALCNPKLDQALQPGDEVIVPALAWPTTFWPLIQNQLIPVVVDVNPETLNLEPRSVEAALSPRTRALMAVHGYGNPCDMDALGKLCARHELLLIEDCTEANGACYNGKAVGSHGCIGTFSFYHSHHMSTMEGGMCITDDPVIDDMIRILRAHGWVRDVRDEKPYAERYPEVDPRFLFVNQGYNLRPTEIQSAIGEIQLLRLPDVLKARQHCAQHLEQAMTPFSRFLRTQKTTPNSEHARFSFPVTLTEEAPFSVADLRTHLSDAGIETRTVSCGNIARQPGFKYVPHRVVGALPHATRIMKHGLLLPVHQDMDEAATNYVIKSLKEFFTHKNLI
ncbi:DegT/DnrJ/EryC1/StrS family aminotransferase [Magnetococcus sp. PR-3]|uniref:DegT/DnrJ/EryC1/StrS family aminotransferase n=1 Tax=Magnetococcus sp. PR-3 TaxID=3120355 RepID=UPI002FCE4791